ncbi:uncharacterized protein LOC128240871 [Mya arenaria]|uniref:uncharacterized protein LOC128240871 n=1 Tax=Mya arenaria TaxID=6604 RepID=UPI0022E66533|nr:uncharacterized protein LOC128240871 [Mya arenaria]
MNIAIYCSLVCVFYLWASAEGVPSNCRVGSACNACPEGQYWTVKVNDALGRPRDLKVCSPTCSKYCRAGNRASDGRPWCQCYDPADIRGDCWKGAQCDTCLAGANAAYGGNINSIPVCCANCEASGLMLGSNLCNCLHNGP